MKKIKRLGVLVLSFIAFDLIGLFAVIFLCYGEICRDPSVQMLNGWRGFITENGKLHIKMLTFALENDYKVISSVGAYLSLAFILIAIIVGIVFMAKKKRAILLPGMFAVILASAATFLTCCYLGDFIEILKLTELTGKKVMLTTIGLLGTAGLGLILSIVLFIVCSVNAFKYYDVLQGEGYGDEELAFEEVQEPAEAIPEAMAAPVVEEPAPVVEEPAPVVEEPVEEKYDKTDLRTLIKEAVKEILGEEKQVQVQAAPRVDANPVIVQYFTGTGNNFGPGSIPNQAQTVIVPQFVQQPVIMPQYVQPARAPAPAPQPQPEVKVEEPVAEPVKEEPVVEEPAPVVEEPVVEEPAPVVEEPVAEEPAPVVEEDIPEVAVAEPVAEEDAEKNPFERIPFAERLLRADDGLKANYNEIKNEILAYGVHSRVSNSGDTFRLHRKTYIKLIIAGKGLKLYFALNPNDYADSTIPVIDASSKLLYEEIPLAFKVKSDLSKKRVKQLIADVLTKDGMEKGEVLDTDWVAQLALGQTEDSSDNQD